MTGLRAWQIITTTKMHFNGKYNAFKYNFNSKHLTESNFNKRTDQYFYTKFSNKYSEYDLKQFAFANTFFKPFVWVGDMSEDVYNDYCKRIQTFTYRFKRNLAMLGTYSFNELLIPKDNDIPIIIKAYLEGDIMAETVIAIHCLTNFLNVAQRQVKETLIWPEIYMQLIKAVPFVYDKFDHDKIKKIIKVRYT